MSSGKPQVNGFMLINVLLYVCGRGPVSEMHLVILQSAAKDRDVQAQQYFLKLITQGTFSENVVT